MTESQVMETESARAMHDVVVGRIAGVFRYPVKSMAGEGLQRVDLTAGGIPGDRQYAFRRLQAKGPFPWLTATRLPRLILYRPEREPGSPGITHVVTPDGRRLALWSDELRDEIAGRHGAPVELAETGEGIFDEAPVSIVTTGTLAALERESGVALDVRRFRPNLLVETESAEPFAEERWIGRTLWLGEGEDAPVVRIDQADVRCAIINLDPETGASSPEVLKTAVRINDNQAGVYAFVERPGTLAVGAPVVLLGG
jgi:uncharacterized protein YcbX